jgi:hypothetical protein
MDISEAWELKLTLDELAELVKAIQLISNPQNKSDELQSVIAKIEALEDEMHEFYKWI